MVTVEYVDNESLPVQSVRATAATLKSPNAFISASNFTESGCTIYTAESRSDTVIVLSRGDAIAFARAVLAGLNSY